MRAKLIRLTAGALLLTAASCSKQVLDTAHLQATLKQQLEAQLGAHNIAVTCPGNVKVMVGATFKCDVSVPASGTLTIDVTQTDDKGDVSYQIVGLTLPSNSPTSPTPSI
jgi:hypothetical protein